MTTLTALLERITEAKGADRGIDRDLGLALAGWEENDDLSSPSLLIDGTYYADSPDGGYPALTASIDAALGLVEKVLPDAQVEFATFSMWSDRTVDATKPRAKIYTTIRGAPAFFDIVAHNVPLAILAALLRAKISEAG